MDMSYAEFQRRRDENKLGEWLISRVESFSHNAGIYIPHNVYTCSACSSRFHGDYLFPTKYCPNCGAYMTNFDAESLYTVAER